MKSYDAEDDSNAAIVAKYKIHSYPHIILTDDSGAVLKETSFFANEADLIEWFSPFLK